MNLSSVDHKIDSAIVRGIQSVGTGKQGSKSCTKELALEILQDLKRGKVPPVRKAAFFGALYIKGLSDDERPLLDAFPAGTFENPTSLAAHLAPDAPEKIQKMCGEMLAGKFFSREQARTLGDFLFNSEEGDSARGLIASCLRVRYTEPEEYAGILDAMKMHYADAFQTAAPQGKPIIQMAEPFDGVERGHLITPILANHFGRRGFRVVQLTGRCSGPKYGRNLDQLAADLEIPHLKSSSSCTGESPQFGWALHQKDLSPAIDRWVEIRKQTIKRPFLATLERFPDPLQASILMVSAFHHGFTDKMIEIAEQAGFPAAIVAFKSNEGTLGLSLGRGTKIECTARKPDGSFERMTFEARPEDFGFTKTPDPELTPEQISQDAKLIKDFVNTGKSGSEYFDQRAHYTVAVWSKALEWVTHRPLT